MVLDEEEEGAVCTEPRLYPAAARIPDHGRGRGRLRALLVDLYKALVHHLGHRYILLTRHSREVCPGLLESVGHPQTSQEGLQVVTLLQLQPRKENLDLTPIHLFWIRPRSELLVRKCFFHLK